MYRPSLKDLPPAAKTHVRPEMDKKTKHASKKTSKAPSNLLPRKMGRLPGANNPLWEDVLNSSRAANPSIQFMQARTSYRFH